jgi:hypothetical protein
MITNTTAVNRYRTHSDKDINAFLATPAMKNANVRPFNGRIKD